MLECDCRGLSCPQPVIMTKKALRENPSGVIAIVNAKVAKENVLRLASFMGYDKVQVLEENSFTYNIKTLTIEAKYFLWRILC